MERKCLINFQNSEMKRHLVQMLKVWIIHLPGRHTKVWHQLRKHGNICITSYRGADKSLARPGRKQAAPVESVMDRGMD